VRRREVEAPEVEVAVVGHEGHVEVVVGQAVAVEGAVLGHEGLVEGVAVQEVEAPKEVAVEREGLVEGVGARGPAAPEAAPFLFILRHASVQRSITGLILWWKSDSACWPMTNLTLPPLATCSACCLVHAVVLELVDDAKEVVVGHEGLVEGVAAREVEVPDVKEVAAGSCRR